MQLELLVLAVILRLGQAEPPAPGGNYLPPRRQTGQNNLSPASTETFGNGGASKSLSNEYGPPNYVPPSPISSNTYSSGYDTVKDNLQPPPAITQNQYPSTQEVESGQTSQASRLNFQNNSLAPSSSYGTPNFQRPSPRGFQSQPSPNNNNFQPTTRNQGNLPKNPSQPTFSNFNYQSQSGPAQQTTQSQVYRAPQMQPGSTIQKQQNSYSPSAGPSRTAPQERTPSQQYGVPQNAPQGQKILTGQQQQPQQQQNQESGPTQNVISQKRNSTRPEQSTPCQEYGAPQNVQQKNQQQLQYQQQPENVADVKGSQSQPGYQDNGSAENNQEGGAGNYEFNYKVTDGQSGVQFGQSETSDGESARGQYNVRLPDGRTQIVDYRSDNNGFRPQMKYEGEENRHQLSSSNKQNNEYSTATENQNYATNQPSMAGNPATETSDAHQSSRNHEFGNQRGTSTTGLPSYQSGNQVAPSQNLHQGQSQGGQDQSRGYQYQQPSNPVSPGPDATTVSQKYKPDNFQPSRFTNNPTPTNRDYPTEKNPGELQPSRQYQDETGYHYKK